MSLRWGYERFKELNSPVKKAEENNDWAWWALFGAVIIMEILVILRISGKI